MFTGIVAGTGEITEISGSEVIRVVIDFNSVSTDGLALGASVSIDGTCLTVVEINSPKISFDVIPETLQKTTLGGLKKNLKNLFPDLWPEIIVLVQKSVMLYVFQIVSKSHL